MQSLKKIHAWAQMKEPLSSVLDISSPVDSVYWCLFLFAFFLLARKSN